MNHPREKNVQKESCEGGDVFEENARNSSFIKPLPNSLNPKKNVGNTVNTPSRDSCNFRDSMIKVNYKYFFYNMCKKKN